VKGNASQYASSAAMYASSSGRGATSEAREKRAAQQNDRQQQLDRLTDKKCLGDFGGGRAETH
jgi:hypothetical protein